MDSILSWSVQVSLTRFQDGWRAPNLTADYRVRGSGLKVPATRAVPRSGSQSNGGMLERFSPNSTPLAAERLAQDRNFRGGFKEFPSACLKAHPRLVPRMRLALIVLFIQLSEIAKIRLRGGSRLLYSELRDPVLGSNGGGEMAETICVRSLEAHNRDLLTCRYSQPLRRRLSSGGSFKNMAGLGSAPHALSVPLNRNWRD